MRHGASAFAIMLISAAGAAEAQEDGRAFGLGQIVVTGERPSNGVGIASQTLDARAIDLFQRQTLDDAINLLPGVSSSNSGGSRNERLLFVRGFDRFQVPLMIDGIRVYLPADNRLDFGRFLTSDVAEVQVAKGYASVLDGPGAMGGLVNLVTRRPTKALEVEGGGSLNLGRNLGYNGYDVFGLVGTKQEKWFAQASYSRNDRDHWDLSGDFAPTPYQPAGKRLFSGSEDWRVNAKIGLTPNATDEYVVNYTRQEGSKNAPLETTWPNTLTRFWSWPEWNIESISLATKTSLGDRAVLRVRAYRNQFDNLLRSFDNASQTTQTLPRAFNSTYKDVAWGGDVHLDLDMTESSKLSVAGFYRQDKHEEYQQAFPSGFVEPPQHAREDVWSAAGEFRQRFGPAIELTLGGSFDWRDLKAAEEYGTPPGGGPAALFSYPLRNGSAANGQGRLVWHADGRTDVHASVSSRARFPSLFERFSSRFGGATSNPDLKAERATQYEIGADRDFGRLRVEVAGFYSKLTDVIVAYPIVWQGQAVTQSRNVGSGEYYGAELSLTAAATERLKFGGNYSWTHRNLDDPSNAMFRPTGVPEHKAFLWADWTPIDALHILPNVDIASDRWLNNTAGTRWFRDGSYVLANITLRFEAPAGVELGVTARNLFDSSYQLADGFPEPGRSIVLTARFRY